MNKTIVDLFDQRASNCPDNIALRCDDKSITYGELYIESSKLASLLGMRGVSNEGLVPILMGPSIDIVIAILGVLKAGGAYVPIDPEFPQERINTILNETTPIVLITISNFKDRIQDDYLRRSIVLEIYRRRSFFGKTLPISPNLSTPDSLAYIIYTSGSTGIPKGVMIENAQLYSYVKSITKELSLEKCNSFAILGTFTADAGHTALFCALALGRSLEVINLKRLQSLDVLKDRFKKHPVDFYKITPSVAEIFLNFEDVRSLLPRKVLVLGGEACNHKVAKGIYKNLYKNCSLVNHYGPTETTVGVTTYRFPQKSTEIPKKIPIGRPLDDVEIFVLNKKYQKVPIDTRGQLFLAGNFVGRGYFKNSELTSKNFVVLKINGIPKRLYKTGDFVKIAPDGNILYLGRNDDQVKLNGHRIELKEIETVVSSSPLIKQCVITVIKLGNNKRTIACYLVPKSGYNETNMRRYCSRKLPSYMIPSYWIVLERLPLSFNNKVDKKSLPFPLPTNDNKASQLDNQANVICDLGVIWKKILRIKKVGNQSDFFSAGGDSLLLIKLSFEIQRKFKIHFSYEDLLQCRTILKQASKIKKELGRTKKGGPESIKISNRIKEVTDSQSILFFQHKLNPLENFPNSTITFKIEGDINVRKIEDAINSIVKQHESLQMSFSFSNGKVTKEFAPVKKIIINEVYSEKYDIDQIIFENLSPFNFSIAPLIKISLFHTRDHKEYLHIDMPHIISDGFSSKIIAQLLIKFYLRKSPIKRQMQFSDFQLKNKEYLLSKRYLKDEIFWQKVAEKFDYSPSEDLIIKPGIVNKLKGVSIVERIGHQSMNEIDSYIKENNLTRFQFFFISYVIFLYNEFSLSAAAVIVPVHNRNNPAFDQVIGLISNMVMLNITIDNKSSLKSFIKYCKSFLLEVLSHSEYPFEKFAELLGSRKISLKQAAPLFFSYNDHEPILRLGCSTLHLHISKRNKENLALSIALFDLGSDVIFRLASRAGSFKETDLVLFGEKFKSICNTLHRLNEQSVIDSLFLTI